jgi:cyclopropane fatty-acyl-phospholipid synthase-like methyltransferase
MGKKNKDKDKKGKKRKRPVAVVEDRHLLYTAAVQSAEADLEFFERIFKRKRGRPLRLLREDFCGTAILACEWVRRRKENRAWGVDLDRPTLDWGIEHYVSKLGPAASRLELLCENVLEAEVPPVDLVAALNFSYCVFKTRQQVKEYFSAIRSALKPGGMLVLDIFGGTDAVCENVEHRKIDASDSFDGTRVPRFTYIWDQARYNPVDHNIVCHIHFKLRDGKKIQRAFTYDWRLWTIPELRELLDEAGFAYSEVYIEGWNEEGDDTDGIFRRRVQFENELGWVAYVVGFCK